MLRDPAEKPDTLYWRAMKGALLVAVAVQVATAAAPDLDALIERGLSAGGAASAIGVTRRGVSIPSLLGEDALDALSEKSQIVIVGGLDGSEQSVELAVQAWEWFHSDDTKPLRERFALAVIPVANPHAWLEAAPRELEFPPEGPYYGSQTNVEAQYLWRWLGLHAPDWVVIPTVSGSGLAAALAENEPAGVGKLRVVQRIDAANGAQLLAPVLQRTPLSHARKQVQARLERAPLEVAGQLAEVYGHELPSVAYIPAVALIGRLRLGALSDDSAILPDVERIMKPYLDGKPTLGEKPSSSHLPGHLVFAELARLTGNTAYIALARRAAGMAFDGGAMRESMPLHNQMSDSVFMGCAILAEAGRLSGERRYFRMALRHLRFMEQLDLRSDGLYRHSPLDEAAWGRGNGFPALGLSWTLDAMPAGAAERDAFLDSYRSLMAALIEHQDPTGMWHQVIDHPGSYRELTSTSMIGYALARGLRNGWIAGEDFEHALERAWRGVKARIAPDGSLADVCRSTGRQPNLQAYLDREALLGRDDRGGAMALLFAVEMARRDR